MKKSQGRVRSMAEVSALEPPEEAVPLVADVPPAAVSVATVRRSVSRGARSALAALSVWLKRVLGTSPCPRSTSEDRRCKTMEL